MPKQALTTGSVDVLPHSGLRKYPLSFPLPDTANQSHPTTCYAESAIRTTGGIRIITNSTNSA